MISVAQFIVHLWLAGVGGGIIAFTWDTWGSWFPEEPEPVVIQLPILRTPQVQGSEENVTIAPGGQSQAGELE